ncbi:unnamed protein product [Cuscuta campestris]|uniref:Uncharacterized protein n=1 Tax=Cuscuta campestris TaxID=132261 RepID=A0A484LIW0_9ASTE|nr:unnamed protein product [Cuscuta campestris]
MGHPTWTKGLSQTHPFRRTLGLDIVDEAVITVLGNQIQSLRLDIDANIKALNDSLYQLQQELEMRIESQFQRMQSTLNATVAALGGSSSGFERTADFASDDSHGRHADCYTPKPKLEAPLCDGSEPLRWLYKVEEYFKFYQTPLDE